MKKRTCGSRIGFRIQIQLSGGCTRLLSNYFARASADIKLSYYDATLANYSSPIDEDLHS